MNLNRRSVLYRYLASYIGIAIVACSIVGAILFSSASRQLLEETRQAEQDRVAMAVADLANHIGIMESIALRVRTGKEYQPFYLLQNPLNRVSMLESFQRFQNYAPLIDQYYLYYPTEGFVFTPTAEYPFYLFAQTVFNERDAEAARRAFETSDAVFTLASQPDVVYFLFPVSFRYQNSHAIAYLFFALERTTVIARYSEMFSLPKEMRVAYRGRTLFSANVPDDAVASAIALDSGALTISVPAYGAGGHADFRTSTLGVVIAVTLAISILSAVIAWRSYLPIRRLSAKMNLNHRADQNEVKLIERMMDNLRMESQDTMTRLTSSLERITVLTDFLRQQLVLRLVTGNLEAGWEEHIDQSGMMLRRPFLFALYVPWQQAMDMEALRKCLEDASTPEVVVYAAHMLGRGGIAAIASANSDEELNGFRLSLKTALFDEGFSADLFPGKIVNRPSDIPISFNTAEMRQIDEPAKPEESWYDREDLEGIRQAFIDGDASKAYDALENILGDLNQNCPSMLMKRYAVIQLTYQLVSIGREMNVFLSEQAVHQVVMAENNTLLFERLRALVSLICDKHKPPVNPVVSPKAQKIMTFINEHAFDYVMCLDLVASTFDISTKQVSRVIKGVCGEPFKTYLLRLRMEKAIALLRAGVNPSEVTRQIGYIDERYFKNRFHEYTGESAVRFFMDNAGRGTAGGTEKNT